MTDDPDQHRRMYCVEDGCRNVATKMRLVGKKDSVPVYEALCDEHYGQPLGMWA